MKIFTIGSCLGATALLLSSLTAAASSPRVGMLIGYETTENENPQESTAAKWFTETYSDGVIITPSTLDKLNSEDLSTVWVHIDRCHIGTGFQNLPEEFKNEKTIAALKKFAADGGSIYLSKFATQMLVELGRLPEGNHPNIVGDGDGGVGTDVWCVNAYLGSMQINAAEPDFTQVYDRTVHSIYTGLESFEPNHSDLANFPHQSFPMLGTGNGDPMHREDHNVMWDLNALSFTSEGKNTLEKFEADHDCVVLGTWGHVQDYCVAGIVEFNATPSFPGKIIANGLAACEWSPREGVNAYHSNLTKLTENTLDYLASFGTTGVGSIASDDSDTTTYYTLQGVRVDNPGSGIYIRISGSKATKVIR